MGDNDVLMQYDWWKGMTELGFYCNHNGVIYYDYSDYETLVCVINEIEKMSGGTVLVVSDLKLKNFMEDNGEVYMQFNYDLHFDNINKFYEFLTLIGYSVK